MTKFFIVEGIASVLYNLTFWSRNETFLDPSIYF